MFLNPDRRVIRRKEELGVRFVNGRCHVETSVCESQNVHTNKETSRSGGIAREESELASTGVYVHRWDVTTDAVTFSPPTRLSPLTPASDTIELA